VTKALYKVQYKDRIFVEKVEVFTFMVKGSGLVDNNNNNKGAGTAPRSRTGRECLIVCLWGYATYLNDHSTLAHVDRGGIHPTTMEPENR
jgi:hypothetical protein